jgi:hypothetical protein
MKIKRKDVAHSNQEGKWSGQKHSSDEQLLVIEQPFTRAHNPFKPVPTSSIPLAFRNRPFLKYLHMISCNTFGYLSEETRQIGDVNEVEPAGLRHVLQKQPMWLRKCHKIVESRPGLARMFQATYIPAAITINFSDAVILPTNEWPVNRLTIGTRSSARKIEILPSHHKDRASTC